jgi:hypothetical protein
MKKQEPIAAEDKFWSRGKCIALADPHCVFCRGLGIRNHKCENEKPCGCTLRKIFKLCFARFRSILYNEAQPGRLSLSTTSFRSTGRSLNYGFPKQEFCADFYLITKRSLTREEFLVFDWHYLHGHDWKLCTEKIGIEKGSFFHLVYVLQEKLGRIYAELRPFALYPIDEYFQGHVAKKPSTKETKILVSPRHATN